MSLPEITTPQQWLEARRELLAREKAQTRERDALNAARRQLPMVPVVKDYVFAGPDGPATLRELFGDSRQLIIQHIMFDPEWEKPCPGCSAALDELSAGVLQHLKSRNTAFAGVSRAPQAMLAPVRASRGWPLAWYSSYGSDFNYDFHVTLDPAVAPVMWNFQTEEEAAADPDPVTASMEVPGLSTFVRDGDEIFHTYTTHARGAEHVGNAYSFLDLTAFGRSEDWEEPKGRPDRLHGADPTFTD